MNTVSIDSDPLPPPLKRFVEGKEFRVHGCEQYMKDNNLQYDGMPVTVELDYGGKL